ncbi:acyltransferase family protein [Microbacterium betulae]|uniref:Acyltransferase family protein n=1 Tax=Microbacterium betulae TaxID=2981139 RepID=A0AA97FGR0_9MICO|nr:acyltransferase family protein [Microbacterium sp. AB]WOF22368.1 acyltransferase family protein [Microbacterium sp. AB]
MITQRPPLRGDIQALRAVAVLFVILNHLWPEHAPGGYVGVDVFFVVSGFLITSHLLREQDQSGRIALGRFWARRARRLLPAALLVLLVSAALAFFVLPSAVRQDDLAQIGWAALYVLNWALAGQSLDYFAQEAGQTLVVHYWSLSVEEQFYLLWPVILVAVFFLSRKLAARTQRRVLVIALSLILLASLLWAQHAVGAEPEAAYFQTTARAWEFAAGGLLALMPAVTDRWRLRLLPLVWIGWAALASSAFVLDSASGVPGWAALLPVVATMLVIGIGEADHPWALRDVTGWRPVQALGDISYSAYLWHFPLIVVAPYLLGHDLLASEKVVILIITLVLAALTKRFVEDPVRFGPLAAMRPRKVLAAALVAMTVVGGGLLGGTAIAQMRADAVHAELMAQAAEGGDCFGAQAVLSGADCPASHLLADATYLEDAPTDTFAGEAGGTEWFACSDDGIAGVSSSECVAGVPEGEQSLNVALIGDSHLSMWRMAVRNLSDDYGMRITTHLLGGCVPSLDPDLRISGGSASPAECWTWRDTLIREIANDPSIDVVVTSARANAYRYEDGTADPGTGYMEAWTLWLEAGKDVIVIDDVPTLSEPIVDCVLAEGAETMDPCSRPRDEARRETGLQRAAEAIDDPALHFVDYTDVLCDEDVCHAIVGSIPAYQDSNHLSVAFTMSFRDALLDPELRTIVESRQGR